MSSITSKTSRLVISETGRSRQGRVSSPFNIRRYSRWVDLAGDQAFHIGGGGGHAGDLVATYSSATNTTTVNLYVNNDATIDSVILMTGDHHNLALGDLFA
jgi:hypothetical protein